MIFKYWKNVKIFKMYLTYFNDIIDVIDIMSSGGAQSSGAHKRKIENMEEFSGQITERKKLPSLAGPSFGNFEKKK